jgi:hypothetical protein
MKYDWTVLDFGRKDLSILTHDQPRIRRQNAVSEQTLSVKNRLSKGYFRAGGYEGG